MKLGIDFPSSLLLGSSQCYRFNCVLLKSICWSPDPQDLRSDLIWRKGLYRSDQVKMRSPGWALIQCDCVRTRKGNLDTETQRRKRM